MIQAPLPDAIEEAEAEAEEGEEDVEVEGDGDVAVAVAVNLELEEEKEEDRMVLVILEGNGFLVLLLRLLLPTHFRLYTMKEVPMPILFSRFQMDVRLVSRSTDPTGQINVLAFKHVGQIMTYRWLHRLRPYLSWPKRFKISCRRDLWSA